MVDFFWLGFGAIARSFRSCQTLLLENLALPQQLTVLKRRHPRPMLTPLDKLFWVLAHKFWSAHPRALLRLGFEVSERTISRWMKRASRDPEPAQRWLAFLRNHREAIAAMDFLTVPTITFGVLYCFFVISHDRRRILHLNVTRHPTSMWIVQQLREAFRFQPAAKFLTFDHDRKYGFEVPRRFHRLGDLLTGTGCDVRMNLSSVYGSNRVILSA